MYVSYSTKILMQIALQSQPLLYILDVRHADKMEFRNFIVLSYLLYYDNTVSTIIKRTLQKEVDKLWIKTMNFLCPVWLSVLDLYSQSRKEE